MTKLERQLLLTVAKALAHLLFWKNVDGRSDGLRIDELVKRVEVEAEMSEGLREHGVD